MLELNDLITQPRLNLDGVTEKLNSITHDVHSTLVSLHQSETSAFFPTQFEQKEGYEKLQATDGFWVKSVNFVFKSKQYSVYLIGCGLVSPDFLTDDVTNTYIIKSKSRDN